jgi:hypothetical protein
VIISTPLSSITNSTSFPPLSVADATRRRDTREIVTHRAADGFGHNQADRWPVGPTAMIGARI